MNRRRGQPGLGSMVSVRAVVREQTARPFGSNQPIERK
jgi:hypothetical protein